MQTDHTGLGTERDTGCCLRRGSGASDRPGLKVGLGTSNLPRWEMEGKALWEGEPVYAKVSDMKGDGMFWE